MNIVLLFELLILTVVVSGNDDSCQESRQLQATCGSYCFSALKPVLDHTKYLHKQVNELNHQSETLAKLEAKEKLIETKFDVLHKNMEQKFEDLRKSIAVKVDRRPFEKLGLKYYYIEQSESLNWFQAVHKCRVLGGSLVSIKNLSEFNAIVPKLQSGRNYWIDISDLATEGEFISLQTGLRATYFNWHKNNPDNWKKVEHCGMLWFHDNKHLMNDADCKGKALFICQPDSL